MLYFAFGSNLLREQLRNRCPDGQYLGVAKLPNYQVFFSGYSQNEKGALASIHPLPGNYVWGAMYELSNEDFAKLDRIEGANQSPPRNNKKLVQCITEDGQVIRAMTYVVRENRPAKPSQAYLDKIVKGAKELELEDNYIESIKRIAQSV